MRTLVICVTAMFIGLAAGCGAPESLEPEEEEEVATALDALRANSTGWHTVCADSLTLRANDGRVLSMRWNDNFYIDHYAEGGNHAWGWWLGPYAYGWVWNGWFCQR